MKVIDMHAHIWPATPDQGEEKILKVVERYGIEEIYISGLNGYFPDEDTVTDINNKVCSFAKRYSDVVKGYVYVSPEHQNALDVLKRGIEEQNMIAVKIWVSDYCDSENIHPLAKQMIDYNIPVMIHAFKKSGGQVARENTSVNIRNLALMYPELKIIMAHVDGNCYNGIPNVYDLENVWVDISGSTGRGTEIEYVYENIGAERILFGTDLPGCSFSVPYGKVMDANIPLADKEKILYSNTKKVFDTKFRIGEGK